MYEYNFIDACLLGKARLSHIDSYVEYWHTNETESTLQDFLGMSDYEYEQWIKNSDVILRDILQCRAHGIKFKDYETMGEKQKIAARSYDMEAIEKLKMDDNE